MSQKADDLKQRFARASALLPPTETAPPVDDGGDGPHDSGMEQRVTRLETHMEYVRKDLHELKAGQKELLTGVAALATKRDLETWRWQWIATGAAIIAIILGGMAFLASALT